MAKRTLYFDKVLNYVVCAATENGKLVTCDIEKDDGSVKMGNIYRGRVKNVVDGMQAAFIDCGLERPCYVSAKDAYPQYVEDASFNLKEGDEVTVQIVRPPYGTKGAKVSLQLSLAGKSLLYMPGTEFLGISHRINDEELKNSLLMEVKKALRPNEGAVIRSAAPFCTYEQMLNELGHLRKIYEDEILSQKDRRFGLLYTDRSLPVRILRDNKIEDVKKIIIGSEEIRDDVNGLMPHLPQTQRPEIEFYAGGGDMLEEYGVSQQILECVSPKVNLEGGANLVIERTEALTVIDVNTARFTGEDNLEQTVYQTNLAAAREIARQVKLRNIGGIVVVDFIDMESQSHRESLVYELNKALQKDPAKCKVLPMSDFGLVQFTRKRLGRGIGDILTVTCPQCGGNGYVLDGDFILLSVRAEIFRLLSKGENGVFVEADPETAKRVTTDKLFWNDLRGRYPFAQISVKANPAKRKGFFICKPLKSGHSPANAEN